MLDLPREQIFVREECLCGREQQPQQLGTCVTREGPWFSKAEGSASLWSGLTLAGLSCAELHPCSAGEEVGA